MKLSNKAYDILKWLCLICIPALAVCYSGLAKVWGWPYSEEIHSSANYICLCIGALIGISTAEFNKER